MDRETGNTKTDWIHQKRKLEEIRVDDRGKSQKIRGAKYNGLGLEVVTDFYEKLQKNDAGWNVGVYA